MQERANQVFSKEKTRQLFPPERTAAFFEALFGDADEGAYDITLHFDGQQSRDDRLAFELRLHQRPGHCLACNLTYGLPEVFSRHPVINIKGLVEAIGAELGRQASAWKLGRTKELSSELHIIPLTVTLA